MGRHGIRQATIYRCCRHLLVVVVTMAVALLMKSWRVLHEQYKAGNRLACR